MEDGGSEGVEKAADNSNDKIESGIMDYEGKKDSVEFTSILPMEIGSKALAEGRISKVKESEIENVPNYERLVVEKSLETVQKEDGPLLDAWYAEYGDPTTNAMLIKQPELVQSSMEVVIGADDRVRINPTTSYPWRCICSLLIIPQVGSQNYMGTGWLVSPRTVITAGHCVYMRNLGGWAKQILVTPGRNGVSRELPYGNSYADHFRSFTAWTNDANSDYDIGAIILPKSLTKFNSLGYFGFASLSDLEGMIANLSGYPGDKDGLPGLRGTQWFNSRTIKEEDSHRFYYDIDTAGGQSGSPAWRFLNGERRVVGVHTNGASTGNSAARITSGVFDVIKAWKYWWG